MTLLERTGLLALVCGAAALGVVACKSTESLGSDDHDGGTGATNGSGGRAGDGGESSSGGTNVAGASGGKASSGGTAGKAAGGTAGRTGSGGTAGKTGSGGTAGKAAGGTAGTAGTAGVGGGGDCSTVSCAPLPPQCPPGTLVAKPAGNCCVQCVPKQQLPLAACVVNGDRYENGETIQWSACSSCVCVDGVIGRCTGACPPGVTDAGPDHHPQCADDQGLIAGCNTCNYEHCEVYEYKCRTLGCDADSGAQCGAEFACVQGACVGLEELCLI
jgi:hypothetical protein